MAGLKKTPRTRAAYQPIFGTGSRRVEFFESVLRIDESPELLGHVRLIEIAEELGFSQHIDLKMLRLACDTLELIDTVLSVNVSQRTISAAGDEYCKIIADNACAGRIIVEITETCCCSSDDVARFASNVRQTGAQVAIDDFGDGHCNIEVALAARPDIIKMVLEESIDASRVKLEQTLIAAAATSARVVAEKVDTPAKMDLANEYGVQYLQGFLLSKPISRSDLGMVAGWTIEEAIARQLSAKPAERLLRLASGSPGQNAEDPANDAGGLLAYAVAR